jgi:hypothetical protein
MSRVDYYREYRAKNRGAAHARAAAHREQTLARNLRYRETHKEELASYRAEYLKTHPKEVSAARAKYKKSHPESVVKYRISRQLGVSMTEIPRSLVDAKTAHLMVVRLLRDLS